MSIVAVDIDNPSNFLLNVAKESVPSVLKVIFTIGKQIKDTMERMKINQHQCERLGKRIETLTGFLHEQNLDDRAGPTLKAALQNFSDFLKDCLAFIQMFANAGRLKRLWNNQDYLAKITELHNEFTQHLVDISAGIGLANVCMNEKSDEKHQQASVGAEKGKENIIEDKPTSAAHSLLAAFMPKHLKKNEECDAKQRHGKNLFKSGIWNYRYYIKSQWQEVSYCDIDFDSKTETFKGTGETHRGRFVLHGSFSQHNHTITFIWDYEDAKLKKPLPRVMELRWDKNRRVFRGENTEKKPGADSLAKHLELSFFAH